MVALAGARGVDERGAVRRQRRGHEDKNHEEEANELFHISITADFYYSKKAGKAQHKGMQRKGVNGVNKMKITIEIGDTKREVYCLERGEDFLTVLSVRKCRGYFPLVYRCTPATVLRLWWQGMLEKIGISDR